MTDRTPDAGSPTEQIDWDALARYLAGESSTDEAHARRRWLEARAERVELVAALERPIGRLAYQAPKDLDVEGALRRVRARRDEPDVRVLPSRPAGVSRFVSRSPRWSAGGLRAAAVLAAIAVGTTLLWQSRRDRAVRETPAV